MTLLSYHPRGHRWRVERGIPFSGGVLSEKIIHNRGLSHREETGGLVVWPIGIKGFKASEESIGVRSERGLYASGRGQRVLHAWALCLKERAQCWKG